MCSQRFGNYETWNERIAVDKLASISRFVNSCKIANNPRQNSCVGEQLVPSQKSTVVAYLNEKPNKKRGVHVNFCSWSYEG